MPGKKRTETAGSIDPAVVIPGRRVGDGVDYPEYRGFGRGDDAMTGRTIGIRAAGLVLLTALSASAQGPAAGSGTLVDNGVGPAYQPPGQYGTSYGMPSYGVPRTYTAFSSPYGAGYGYGYAPYVYSQNWFTLHGGGVSLVRPGYSVPGYVYGGSLYNTFPVPFTVVGPQAPPFGAYAPTFAPGGFYAY